MGDGIHLSLISTNSVFSQRMDLGAKKPFPDPRLDTVKYLTYKVGGE